MRVELLYWDGCPSHPRALAELRAAMDELGLDPHAVAVRRVHTDGAAEDEGFVGSPTIRIDGEDVVHPGGEPVGLTCRVYYRRDGRVDAVPDPDDLRDALRRAMNRQEPPMSLSIGDRAPGFSLPAVAGGEEGLNGRGPAVVVFTCNHCPYALAWHDRILDVARDVAVPFLLVNPNDAERYPRDSFEAMKERVEEDGGWPVPYLRDEDQRVARAYGARTTPDVFVIARDGTLAYRGAPDADHTDPGLRAQWLRAALQAVLDGAAPEPAETEPVGCSVKWKP